MYGYYLGAKIVCLFYLKRKVALYPSINNCLIIGQIIQNNAGALDRARISGWQPQIFFAASASDHSDACNPRDKGRLGKTSPGVSRCFADKA
jgi:hypothetical protein